MNTTKKLLAVGLTSLLIAFSLNAQSAPNASVNENGELVLEGGEVIPVPEGTVDNDGDLVIDGVTIPAPIATVNADGSLTVGNQTFPVPTLPVGGEFIISWFGDDMVDMDVNIPVTSDQWYWNFKFKFLLHQAVGNWFYSLEFNAWMYVSPDGNDPDQGFWAYFVDLFNGQTQGIWAYMWTSPQYDFFSDLRDQDYDGVNEIDPALAGAQTMDGWLWVLNASGYDNEGEGLFWFSEYGDGNWITRVWSNVGNPNPYWTKVSDPVQ